MTTRSPYGLCQDCLTTSGLDTIMVTNKPLTCVNCQKEPDILFNQDPYCHTCYIQTISSPTKSEMTSQRETKMKSFYKTIDKDEVKNMKKTIIFGNDNIIKKISKIFDENTNESQLLNYLNKKALSFKNLEWEKLIAKVHKTPNILYVFIGKKKIIGAFHTQAISIEGEATTEDAEAGIFSTDLQVPNLEFARVKSNLVSYSSKTKSIRFGCPSSFEIELIKKLKVTSELVQEFEVTNAFIYKI